MNGKLILFRRPMTPQEFEIELRRRAAPGFSHMVIFRDHASEQMAARGITRMMVMRVLQRGSVDGRKLRWDEGHANWTAPVVGIAAGVEVVAVCALTKAGQTVVVITAINRGSPE